jgi:hypothetical protein
MPPLPVASCGWRPSEDLATGLRSQPMPPTRACPAAAQGSPLFSSTGLWR